MEHSQANKAEKNKNFHLPSKINFDRFLCEGMGYLGMVNNLNSWITPNSTKNMILRKTLNGLGRVRFQYKRMLRMRDLLLNGIIDNYIREDIIISIDDVIPENDEVRIDIADEYDIDEYEIIEFYDWQSQRKIRTRLLRKMNLLMDKIFYEIIKRHLMLCLRIKKYCKKATEFLYNKRKTLKSSKLYQMQNSCCKYHFLKQLIACCYHVSSLN